MKIQIKSFLPAIGGLVFATLLFCLPGDEIPDAGWLDDLQLDKVVHIGLFTMLVFLWCLPMQSRFHEKRQLNKAHLWVALAFAAYGIVIEFIQRDFIPYRSFDFFDIVADVVGCVIGWIAARKLAD